MLDANDVRVLEKMLDQKLGGLRDEMHQEFKNVRGEMRQGFDEVRQEFVIVRGEMAKGFEKVRDDIIDVIDQNIQPQLTSAVSRITRLERKMA
jgi:hypothetical protein